jgi:RNA polymerase sigma-70 factor (ECF subfamily)
LAATAAGDRAAFAVFYRRHLPGVVGALMRETRDRELSGDLAAEVFATALLSASRFRADYPSALPWLCGIARHKVSESRRRGRAEMSARRRLGIPREPLDERDYGEIAASLGTSEAAVRQNVKRALAWLRTRTSEENR